MNNNIVVRPAVREDMVQIFGFIRELAIFEKMEDQVKVSLATLQHDGFDTDNPPFKCLVAVPKTPSSDSLLGYALYYNCYSTWIGTSIFLEDLYVKEAARGTGAGKALFLAVAKIAHGLSARMDFHVLAWNPAVEFYRSMGAVSLSETEEWRVWRLANEAMSGVLRKNGLL